MDKKRYTKPRYARVIGQAGRVKMKALTPEKVREAVRLIKDQGWTRKRVARSFGVAETSIRYWVGPMQKPSIEERFWQKVKKADCNECWVWTAGKNHHGYGAFWVSRERGRMAASRFAFELYNVPLLPGEEVAHRCDNPACCNPAHLFRATRESNMRDMAMKLRTGNRKLNPEDVRNIRADWRDNGGIKRIARKWGLSRGCIGAIVKRRNWQWIPDGHDNTTGLDCLT